jgi:hypothetical protein
MEQMETMELKVYKVYRVSKELLAQVLKEYQEQKLLRYTIVTQT